MYTSTNKFGTMKIYTGEDLLQSHNKVFIFNCACLTIHTEVLGWANKNKEFITTDIDQANYIIVLGCQVTDLAVLNDFKTYKKLEKKYPQKMIMFGGCLGQRFDLYPEINRVDLLTSDYEEIVDAELVTWQKPFWIPKPSDNNFLFDKRYNYIRIGKGCHGKCKYCTIRVTRKSYIALDIDKLIPQIIKYPEKIVVPVCDTLLPNQIQQLFEISKAHNITFALRNIEPQNAVKVKEILLEWGALGLLETVHIPIQSSDPRVLLRMNRDTASAWDSLKLCKSLKQLGVFVATNIIIDYEKEDMEFGQYDRIYELYDHVAWNPYWNGHYDQDAAEERMKKYLPFYEIRLA